MMESHSQVDRETLRSAAVASLRDWATQWLPATRPPTSPLLCEGRVEDDNASVELSDAELRRPEGLDEAWNAFMVQVQSSPVSAATRRPSPLDQVAADTPTAPQNYRPSERSPERPISSSPICSVAVDTYDRGGVPPAGTQTLVAGLQELSANAVSDGKSCEAHSDAALAAQGERHRKVRAVTVHMYIEEPVPN